jgi:hypothetical protein
MNFLIGNMDTPNTPNEADFGRELDENKSNQGGGTQTDPPPVDPSTGGQGKKTNWYLYAILGIVALGLIMGNKK